MTPPHGVFTAVRSRLASWLLRASTVLDPHWPDATLAPDMRDGCVLCGCPGHETGDV